MSRWRETDEVFQHQEFLDAVETFRIRQRLTITDLARQAGCNFQSMKEILRKDNLSLFMACRLADICDLSLDEYRRNDGQSRTTRVA